MFGLKCMREPQTKAMVVPKVGGAGHREKDVQGPVESHDA